MSDSLYVAMAGAKQTMIAQAVNSNNLANVNTAGFRADLYNANQLALFGEGFPSDVYATSEAPIPDYSPGAIHTTDRQLDVAIQGKGWFAVQRPDGTEGYTRAGSFQRNANGQLTTASGLPVLGNGGPIAIPAAESITIANDGTISIRPIGADEKSLAVIDRLKLVNPDQTQLIKGQDGLFSMVDGAQPEADAAVKIVSGALESSNVNAVDAMVNIISLSRQFEMQIKMMQQTESHADVLAQLLQL